MPQLSQACLMSPPPNPPARRADVNPYRSETNVNSGELMKIKNFAEVVGLVPAAIAYLKPLPTWFRPSGNLEPNITIAALAVSSATCLATWVLFEFVGGPPARWTDDRKRSIFRRAVGSFIVA